MVPDIAYDYARSRFRQMLLDGAELDDAQQWRQIFLSRYGAQHEVRSPVAVASATHLDAPNEPFTARDSAVSQEP